MSQESRENDLVKAELLKSLSPELQEKYRELKDNVKKQQAILDEIDADPLDRLHDPDGGDFYRARNSWYGAQNQLDAFEAKHLRKIHESTPPKPAPAFDMDYSKNDEQGQALFARYLYITLKDDPKKREDIVRKQDDASLDSLLGYQHFEFASKGERLSSLIAKVRQERRLKAIDEEVQAALAAQVVESAPVSPAPQVVESAPVSPAPQVVESAPVSPASQAVESAPVSPAPQAVESAPVSQVVESAPVSPALQIPQASSAPQPQHNHQQTLPTGNTSRFYSFCSAVAAKAKNAVSGNFLLECISSFCSSVYNRLSGKRFQEGMADIRSRENASVSNNNNANNDNNDSKPGPKN